jgi:HEAT repeat protein
LRWKCLFALLSTGMLLAAGCSGPPTMDSGKLSTPVNAAMPSTSGDSGQIAASDALGRIGQPAVAALSSVLSDPDPVVRLQACRALAYMGPQAKDAVPYLTQSLGDQNETVRDQAAVALGQIGAPAAPAVPVLMQMLRASSK